MNSLYLTIKNVFKTCIKNPLVNILLLLGFAATTHAQCNINITVSGLNSNGVLCSGTSATLTSDAIANYTWTPGISISAALIVSPTVTTTYTLNATSSNNCPGVAYATVSVVLTPTLVPTQSQTLICEGNSATLTATGATGYTWTGGSSPANTNTYVVTPPAGINSFTVVRSISGCTSTVQKIVVVNALPTVYAIANPTLVCAGQQSSLTIAGGTSWTWTAQNPTTSLTYSFSNSATPVVFPLVASIYTVAAYDGTCVNTATVEVQTNPTPTIVGMATSTSICSGGTVTINASGSNSYTITQTGTNSLTVLTSVPFTQTLYAPTSFAITGVNSFSCYSTFNQIVVANPLPQITATVIPTRTIVCSSGSTTIGAYSGSGGLAAHSYTWSTGALTPTAIVNPTNTITGPVIYTVTGTNTITTCSADQTVAVTVFIPTVSITGNTATCIGKGLALTAGNAGGTQLSYKWYTVPGATAPTSVAPVLAIGSLTAPAQYTLVATTTSGSAQNCVTTKTIDVSIFYNPVITAVAQRTPICSGESVSLTAGGGVTYQWSTGDVGQVAVVSPTFNTNYTVTGQDANSCENTMTVQVKVSTCAGIGKTDLTNIGLSVYPNPNNGEFVIQSQSNLKLNLLNDLGQLVRTIELSGTNGYKVSVSDLPKGIYFLSGEANKQQIRQKIIIAK